MIHARPADRVRMIAAAAIAIASLALSACKPRVAADGQSHAGADPHDHGHDHGHGGGEAHADEVRLTAEAIDRHGIKIDAAQLWVLRPTYTVPARVEFNSEAMAHVGSPLRGRAVEVRVRLGAAVHKGDSLVIIESPELGEAQATYLQKKTAAKVAAPSVDLAKSAWERARALHERDQSVSLAEVNRREAEYRTAVGIQATADAEVTAAAHRLRLVGMSDGAVEELDRSGVISTRTSIAAPIDGVVIEREVTTGELVGPDREPLLTIADTSVLWVLADVPESRFGDVVTGVTAWIDAGGEKIEGKVAYMAPRVDAATRTARARIELPGSAATLKPGMFVQVEFVAKAAGEPAPAIAVPDSAILTVEGGPAIFVPVPNEPNTFAKRAVIVGKAVGGLVPIQSGLVEGEKFVTSGAFILKAELGKASASHEH